MVAATVSIKNVDEVVRELKQFEDKAIASLRSDLKVRLNPIASMVASQIPRESPLRPSRKPNGTLKGGGMNHRGATRWRGVNKPVVQFTPGRRRDKSYKLVNIAMTGGKRGLGFDYAELAGIRRRSPRPISKPYQRRGDGVVRQHRINGQGDGLIKALREQVGEAPGRFAFIRFLRKRPELTAIALRTINEAAEKVNRKIRAL